MLFETVLTLTSFILSIIFTIMLLNYSKPLATNVSLWRFVTTYLLMASIIFLAISVVELLEFLNDFGLFSGADTINYATYVYLVIPASLLIHIYAIYRLHSIVEFNVENFHPNRIGMPIVYVAIFWLLSIELPEFGSVAYDITLISEFIYILSLPIVLAIIYLTLKEKKIEDAIIQLPIESIDKLAGISLSIAIFSLAVFMKVHRYHIVYDQLEAFALMVFIVSGELYRRTLFKIRKIM